MKIFQNTFIYIYIYIPTWISNEVLEVADSDTMSASFAAFFLNIETLKSLNILVENS